MAAEQTGTETDPDEDSVQWADQDQYQEQVKEPENVVLPRGNMKMRIVQEEPMRQAALVDRYDVTDLEDQVQDLPDEANIQKNPQGMDLDDADDVLRMVAYMRDLLVPNVLKPAVHWADPDADGFDLSALHDDDLKFLVRKISGKDAGVIDSEKPPAERKQERAEQFRQ